MFHSYLKDFIFQKIWQNGPGKYFCIDFVTHQILRRNWQEQQEFKHAVNLTSLPYIIRWCVVMRALKTTTQLWFAVLSNNVSAKWGIFTFSSLVQCIRSVDDVENRAETMTVHDPGWLYCAWMSLWTYWWVEIAVQKPGVRKIFFLLFNNALKG